MPITNYDKSISAPYPEIADIETASDDYAARFSGTVGDYFLRLQAKITLDLIKDLPRVSVLDIGGGHAQLAVPLAQNGYKVTVTGSNDICKKRLDNLLKDGSLSYKTCDSLHLPYENGQFDIVMAFRLLPHTRQWQKLIGEMCRVANKAVVLDYPDKRSTNVFYNVLFNLKKKAEGNTRTYFMFSRQMLSDEFAQNNFQRPSFHPEFFLPMVIHRKLKQPSFSQFFEAMFKIFFLTRTFGSPIILRSNKNK